MLRAAQNKRKSIEKRSLSKGLAPLSFSSSRPPYLEIQLLRNLDTPLGVDPLNGPLGLAVVVDGVIEPGHSYSGDV